jgi:hypothetical protein
VLLEHCLRTLDANASPLDQARRALVVGQILGRQFSHKDEIRVTLERRLYLEESVSIVGLSLGWPTSDTLNKAYEPIRKNGWVGQRVQWAPALQISGVLGSAEEFAYFLELILSNGVGYVWEFLDFCVPTTIARLKQDDALASCCLDKLHNGPTADHKAGLPRLLVASIGLNDEIKKLCAGHDAGQIRPVAHSLLDVLVPRTS